jgi:hypothetical protein
MSKYSNKFRKILFDKITNLSNTEHEEIFKMVKNSSTSFTQNKNGIFFNISSVDDILIDEIDKFVSYCMNNKSILDEYDKKLNECKINNNFENIIPAAQGINHNDNIENIYVEHSVKIKEDEEWICLQSIENKKMQKIINFVEKMAADHEKIGKKKMNVKFHNARKKYSKRIMTDKRFGDGNEDDITELSYDR